MAMYVIVVDQSKRNSDPSEPGDYVVFGQPGGNCPFPSFEAAHDYGDAYIGRPWRVASLDFSEWPDDPNDI